MWQFKLWLTINTNNFLDIFWGHLQMNEILTFVSEIKQIQI